jgi:hypothetical protein
MKYIVFLFFITFYSFQSKSQTASDSLYNTKFYPVHDGCFMVIGSEKQGSYRKAVIRLYDSNLKIIKEYRQKNGRSSDIFLDEILPDQYRIIDRYRWNKGKVKLFDKNLELKSSVFFKRDDYKDWMIKTDEAPGYPLRKDEHFFGLDPIYFSDSLCFYYNKNHHAIEISGINFTAVKPVFIPVVTCNLISGEEIVQYKFKKLEDGRIAFFYSADEKGKRINYFSVIDLKADSDCKLNNWKLEENSDSDFIVSDFTFRADKLITAGSYSFRSPENVNKADSLLKKMNGFFINAYKMNKDSLVSVGSFLDTNYLKGNTDIAGFKVHELKETNGEISGIFEKINVYKKSSKTGKVNETYYVYESPSFISFNFNISDHTIYQEEFALNYNPENAKELTDKQWRTFQRKKGQTPEHLIFNGKISKGYNDLSIKHCSENKVIYTDRNDNILMAKWTEHSFSADLIYLKKLNEKCYFYKDYFLKYSTGDFGYTLEKVKY